MGNESSVPSPVCCKGRQKDKTPKVKSVTFFTEDPDVNPDAKGRESKIGGVTKIAHFADTVKTMWAQVHLVDDVELNGVVTWNHHKPVEVKNGKLETIPTEEGRASFEGFGNLITSHLDTKWVVGYYTLNLKFSYQQKAIPIAQFVVHRDAPALIESIRLDYKPVGKGNRVTCDLVSPHMRLTEGARQIEATFKLSHKLVDSRCRINVYLQNDEGSGESLMATQEVESPLSFSAVKGKLAPARRVCFSGGQGKAPAFPKGGYRLELQVTDPLEDMKFKTIGMAQTTAGE